MLDVEKVPQFRVEHKVEEAAEGSEHNYELHDECGKSNKTETNGGGNLFEGFLETVMKMSYTFSRTCKIQIFYLNNLHNLRREQNTVIETTSSY